MSRTLSAGKVLKERYEIVELVGRGGMGATYRAADLRLEGRYCAVKEAIPTPDATPDEVKQSREQFYQEASTLARLDHPNLPKVSDYFSEDERDYLVMDFVPGQDLHEILTKALSDGHALPERQVLVWADQLCEALNYLHSQDPPVLHRDIKPSNIKVTPSGNVKLVDFGLVKLLAADDERTITVMQGRGSVLYTPLEQYGSDTGHTDARSDIYSLCATLYHLLTGQPPLDAKSRFLKPRSMPTPRSLNSSISPQTERSILWGLAMHPDDRPSSILDLQRDLFAPGPVSRAVARLLDQDKPPFQLVRANRALMAVIAALLLAAILLTASPPAITSTPAADLSISPTAEREPSSKLLPVLAVTKTVTVSVTPAAVPSNRPR